MKSPPARTTSTRRERHRKAQRRWALIFVAGMVAMIPSYWIEGGWPFGLVFTGIMALGLLGLAFQKALSLLFPPVLRRLAGGPGMPRDALVDGYEFLDSYYDRDDWSWELHRWRFAQKGDVEYYEVDFTDCDRIHGTLRLTRKNNEWWKPSLTEDRSRLFR